MAYVRVVTLVCNNANYQHLNLLEITCNEYPLMKSGETWTCAGTQATTPNASWPPDTTFLLTTPILTTMPSPQDRTLLILSTAAGLAATTALFRAYGFLTTTRQQATTTAGQIADRAPQAFTNLLAAFGPNGANALDTPAGCMIASPSRPGSRKKTENDNYFFQWCEVI